MSGNSKNRVFDDLKDKEARDAYVDGHARAGIAYQIRAMRDSRKWSQEELGKRMGGKPQSAVARLENPDYGRLSVSTLLEVASAFDIALLVRFVPFSEFLGRVQDMNLDELAPPNYEFDQGFKPSTITPLAPVIERLTATGGASVFGSPDQPWRVTTVRQTRHPRQSLPASNPSARWA